MHWNRKYTPELKVQGYPVSMRKQASEMYVDGDNLRRITRRLKIHHRTVALWVNNHAEALPLVPMPNDVKEAEMDELFTFIGDKKTESTFLRLSTAKLAVFWAGRASGYEPRQQYDL